MSLASPGLYGGVEHGPTLDAGDADRNADHYGRFEEIEPPRDLADEVTEHRLSDHEVRDHPVAHRASHDHPPGSTSQHLASFGSDGEHLRVGGGIGNDR